MTDRELLEAAARAAGIKWFGIVGDSDCECRFFDIGEDEVVKWNPLRDDADVSRLEAALNIDIEWHTIVVVASVCDRDLDYTTERFREPYADHDGDKQKARRYATVRAAAAIGSKHE